MTATATPACPAARRVCASLVFALMLLPFVAAPAAGTGVVQDTFPPVVIRNVRVFDGERVLPSATVVLADRRIAAVALPGEPLDVPPGADVIDGAGRTLLPGLIDAHAHTFSRNQLKGALAFGVSTHLDMFTDVSVMRAMKAEQAAGGAADRADLYSAGTLLTAAGGHGTQYDLVIPTLSGPDQARAFVDARIAEGSDYIKIVLERGMPGMPMPTLDVATVRAGIDAAHARGWLAVVHISTGDAARDAINAGADGLAHIFPDRAPRDDLGSLAASRGVFVVPTLAVMDGIYSRRGGRAVLDDPVLSRRLFPADRENLDVSDLMTMGAMPGDIAHAFAAVRLLHDAGVPILAGTDAPNPGTAHGASLHRELELLVHAGLSPLEALQAATSIAARAFRLDDRGRIARGLRADVVLVDGDPTTDIRMTRAVVGVWKEGRRYRLELYDAQLAQLNAAANAEVGGPPPAGAGSGIVSLFDESDAIGRPPRSRFGTGWDAATDAPTGTSTVTLNVVAGGAAGTRGALAVRGELGTGAAFPFAGARFRPTADDGVGVNLSSFDTLSFRVRGDGRSYMIYFYDLAGGADARYEFRAGPEWSDVVVPFAQLGYDGRGMRSILFTAIGAPRSFSFLIDDVRFR
jgi:imidazolonepropionase-like amidohydrolase